MSRKYCWVTTCGSRIVNETVSFPRPVDSVRLLSFSYSILWLEVLTEQSRRVTVLGCQDGYVKVAVTDLSGEPSKLFL